MGGMGGAGGAGMGNMSEMTARMLEDPAMRESMITMMSQPGMMDMIAASNPQLNQMLNAMPGIRETMSNPEMLRAMLNPDMMRMAMGMVRLQRAGPSVLALLFGSCVVSRGSCASWCCVCHIAVCNIYSDTFHQPRRCSEPALQLMGAVGFVSCLLSRMDVTFAGLEPHPLSLSLWMCEHSILNLMLLVLLVVLVQGGGAGGATAGSGDAAAGPGGMFNPAMLASMLSGAGGAAGGPSGAGGAGGGLQGLMGMLNSMQMGGMGGLGGFGGPAPVADPATTYATQIQQLQVGRVVPLRQCACTCGTLLGLTASDILLVVKGHVPVNFTAVAQAGSAMLLLFYCCFTEVLCWHCCRTWAFMTRTRTSGLCRQAAAMSMQQLSGCCRASLEAAATLAATAPGSMSARVHVTVSLPARAAGAGVSFGGFNLQYCVMNCICTHDAHIKITCLIFFQVLIVNQTVQCVGCCCLILCVAHMQRRLWQWHCSWCLKNDLHWLYQPHMTCKYGRAAYVLRFCLSFSYAISSCNHVLVFLEIVAILGLRLSQFKHWSTRWSNNSDSTWARVMTMSIQNNV
jgi:hypothetical protein